MSKLITISGVCGYIGENGVAQLNLEDCSRGLGFTTMVNGKEYVKWDRVAGYLIDLGFLSQVTKDKPLQEQLPEFIPENIFYRLAMKAKNETAEVFQAKVADEILPQIRRTGMYAIKPMSQLEILAQATQALLEQDKEIKRLSFEQTKQEKQIKVIKETIVERKDEWRNWVNDRINFIAKKRGNEYTQTRAESYKLLEERAGCNLKTRVNNVKKRMAEQGICKTKINLVNKLDVIEEDQKIKEIYTAIVKEMSIKYVA